MNSSGKSSQQDSKSGAENEHLMPHEGHHDEEKDESSDGSFYVQRKTSIQFTRSGLLTLIASTALSAALLSALSLHILHILYPSLPQPGTKFGSCGSSPSSARAANCTFDIMSFSWLPQACSDPELTSEFSSIRDWTWWVDQERTESVAFKEVAKGDHESLFVSREYHMYHCMYMWRKLHRGMLKSEDNEDRRGVVDTYIGSYGHTAHCEMMLLGMEGEEGGVVNKSATDTAILMKFPQCMWT